MKPIIEISGLGKKYPIVHDKVQYGTLRDSIMNFAKNPFAKRKTHEEFWALKDINLSIEKGDIVGIIGKNGAGKSTLLKIIAGITKPTEGNVKLYGRVSSLLEVGTGFHPELTGRENIFLNGVILGMTRKEVAKKFDRIVEFAGIEKFLDTPVKHYSSGMYVRLAFAVAAHLEPDILIVDEVLAVGDMEFQKKCLGKMGEISKNEGRTVLFVSHNMNAIKQLCKTCILLHDGNMIGIGMTDKITDQYLLSKKAVQAVNNFTADANKKAFIHKISILDSNGSPSIKLSIDKPFKIEVEYEITRDIKDCVMCLTVFSDDDYLLLRSADGDKYGQLLEYKVGRYKTIIEIPSFLFNVGSYSFSIAIDKTYVEYVDLKQDLGFEIVNTINNPKAKILNGNSFGKMAAILNYQNYRI